MLSEQGTNLVNIPPLRNLKATYSVSGQLNLTWYPPKRRGVDTAGYKILYKLIKPGQGPPTSIREFSLLPAPYPRRQMTINASPSHNVSYAFLIRAYADQGDGRLSNIIYAYVPPKLNYKGPTTRKTPSHVTTALPSNAPKQNEESGSTRLIVIASVAACFIVVGTILGVLLVWWKFSQLRDPPPRKKTSPSSKPRLVSSKKLTEGKHPSSNLLSNVPRLFVNMQPAVDYSTLQFENFKKKN